MTDLLPNGDYIGSSAVWTKTGFSNVYQCLNDSSDSTYVQRTSGTIPGDYFGQVGTTTIGATSDVEYVRCRVKCSLPAAGSRVRFGVAYEQAGGVGWGSWGDIQLSGVNGNAWYDGPWSYKTYQGELWTQALIDSLLVFITDECLATGDRATIYEAKIEVTTRARPTVTVTAPTGTTANPQPAWTYASTEGLPQRAFQVKVFTAAQYGAGGFDPETSTATYEGPVVYGPNTSWTIPDLSWLNDATTYRTYVKVAQQVAWGTQWGAWSYSGWTSMLSRPPSVKLVNAAAYEDQAIRLKVLPEVNCLPRTMSDMEAGITGWSALTNCSVAQSNTYKKSGVYSLRATATGAGQIVVQSDQVSSLGWTTGSYGVTLTASGRTPDATRTWRMKAIWYDSSGSTLRTDTSPDNNTGTTSFFENNWITLTPYGADRVRLQIEIDGMGAGQYAYIDEVGVIAQHKWMQPWNGAMELWNSTSDAQGWSATGGNTFARESTIKKAGSYSLRCEWQNPSNAMEECIQQWTCHQHVGSLVVVAWWVYVPTGSPDVTLWNDQGGWDTTWSLHAISTSTKDTWVKLMGRYRAIDESPQIRLYNATGSSGTGKYVYVDSVFSGAHEDYSDATWATLDFVARSTRFWSPGGYTSCRVWAESRSWKSYDSYDHAVPWVRPDGYGTDPVDELNPYTLTGLTKPPEYGVTFDDRFAMRTRYEDGEDAEAAHRIYCEWYDTVTAQWVRAADATTRQPLLSDDRWWLAGYSDISTALSRYPDNESWVSAEIAPMPLRVLTNPKSSHLTRAGVFEPLGAERSVVVRGDDLGRTFTVEVATTGQVEAIRLEALLRCGDVLGLRVPWAVQDYYDQQATKDAFVAPLPGWSYTYMGTPASERRRYSIEFREVAYR